MYAHINGNAFALPCQYPYEDDFKELLFVQIKCCLSKYAQ